MEKEQHGFSIIIDSLSICLYVVGTKGTDDINWAILQEVINGQMDELCIMIINKMSNCNVLTISLTRSSPTALLYS